MEEQLYSFLIFVVVLICIVFDFVRVENGTKILFLDKKSLGLTFIAWFIRKIKALAFTPAVTLHLISAMHCALIHVTIHSTKLSAGRRIWYKNIVGSLLA